MRCHCYMSLCVASMSIFVAESVISEIPLMRGRAAFVYSASTVDTIGRMPSKCWRHVRDGRPTSSSDIPDIRRESRFYTSRAFDAAIKLNSLQYSIAYNQRRRCCAWKGGKAVAHCCNWPLPRPRLPDMRLADALVIFNLLHKCRIMFAL